MLATKTSVFRFADVGVREGVRRSHSRREDERLVSRVPVE